MNIYLARETCAVIEVWSNSNAAFDCSLFDIHFVGDFFVDVFYGNGDCVWCAACV